MTAIGIGIGIPFGARSVVAEFAPTDLDGVVLWLRADMGVEVSAGVPAEDTDPVLNWLDQSAEANDVAQATEANRPLWSADGGPDDQPHLGFDGVNDTMGRADFALTSAWTAYLVLLPSVAAAITNEVFYGSVTASDVFVRANSATQLELFAGVNLLHTVADARQWMRLEVVKDGATSSIRDDDNAATEGNAGTSTGAQLSISSYHLASNHTDCRIAEIIHYDRRLTDPERAQVQAYLLERYPSLA
jgi:hypothetical protein